MAITVEQLVSREVHYCVSFLVSTLAGGYGVIENAPRLRDRGSNAADLAEAAEQAMELASPVDDWEEAATQQGAKLRAIGGWRFDDGRDGVYETAQELCEANDIEPYQSEVYEHWIVSDWLADRLAEKGEKVEKDFVGLIVWARTTTGQGIASDSVIEAIHRELVEG